MTSEEIHLRQILYNPIIRDKFINFDENKDYFCSCDKEEYISKLEDLIINDIKRMTIDTFDLDLIISWYDIFLKDLYFSDVYLVFNSKFNNMLFAKEKELDIDISAYTTYLSNLFESNSMIQKYNECLERYLDLRNLNYLTNEDFERYVFALNINEVHTEEDFAYIFNMILDKKYVLSDLEYQKFFQAFGVFIMNEFGIENPKVSLSSVLKSVGRYKLEISDEKTINNVLLNKGRVKSSNILENLETLFHEIKHAIQKKELCELYRLDVLKQLEDTLLKTVLGKEYYEINYNYLSGETDAIVCSQILLSEFLKLYAPLTYRARKEELDAMIENALKLENINTRGLNYNNEYDLQTLFTSMLSNNLQILNEDMLNDGQRNVLLQVYNLDGTPKTPDVYFKAKEELLKQQSETLLTDEETLMKIKEKINFYDAILNTFEYNIENLRRNYIALNEYNPVNNEIQAEVMQYKRKVERKLLKYNQGIQVIQFPEKSGVTK